MGVKGFVRSAKASIKQAERNARRRHRELERQRQQYENMQALAMAQYEVDCYENKLDLLSSIHKECGNTWNWGFIRESNPPPQPVKSTQNENIARANLENFKPGFASKLFGGSDQHRNKLVKAVEDARWLDASAYQDALEKYQQDYRGWEAIRNLAARILANDREAYAQAIREINPFQELSQLGSAISFSVNERLSIEVDIRPNGEDVIPSETKSVLKSGELSVKKMPKERFYELYQDYVCGCALRVARELFALLPVEMVFVHALVKLLNPQTGHLTEMPVLSAAIPRQTLFTLNFEMLDPSDSMANFLYKMNFKKTKGFGAVQKLFPVDFR